MKNIHVLPTDKRSKLYKEDSVYKLDNLVYGTGNQNIYITNSEEIKDGWHFNNSIGVNKPVFVKNEDVESIKAIYGEKINHLKKIILTTDQSLDGVQAIDDEFLEWFVKNPSCESVEVKSLKTIPALQLTGNNHCMYQLIIPKEEPKNICFQTGLPCGMQCFSEEACNTIRLKHTPKFIVFTLQDSEDWVQHSIPLDSFEKADNFCQQFRDKKMSYLICQTLKQGYNGK